MKNIIFLTIIIITLQGCLVTNKSYKLRAEINKTERSTTKDSLYISCDLPRGDERGLGISIWFDVKKRQEGINDISVKIEPDNGQILIFEHVKMTPMKFWNSAHANSDYIKKDFHDLPVKDRFTTIDGQTVYYDFDFKAVQDIRSKSLNIFVTVQLKSGETIEIKGNYLRVKRTFFSVH